MVNLLKIGGYLEENGRSNFNESSVAQISGVITMIFTLLIEGMLPKYRDFSHESPVYFVLLKRNAKWPKVIEICKKPWQSRSLKLFYGIFTDYTWVLNDSQESNDVYFYLKKQKHLLSFVNTSKFTNNSCNFDGESNQLFIRKCGNCQNTCIYLCERCDTLLYLDNSNNVYCKCGILDEYRLLCGKEECGAEKLYCIITPLK